MSYIIESTDELEQDDINEDMEEIGAQETQLNEDEYIFDGNFVKGMSVSQEEFEPVSIEESVEIPSENTEKNDQKAQLNEDEYIFDGNFIKRMSVSQEEFTPASIEESTEIPYEEVEDEEKEVLEEEPRDKSCTFDGNLVVGLTIAEKDELEKNEKRINELREALKNDAIRKEQLQKEKEEAERKIYELVNSYTQEELENLKELEELQNNLSNIETELAQIEKNEISNNKEIENILTSMYEKYDIVKKQEIELAEEDEPLFGTNEENEMGEELKESEPQNYAQQNQFSQNPNQQSNIEEPKKEENKPEEVKNEENTKDVQQENEIVEEEELGKLSINFDFESGEYTITDESGKINYSINSLDKKEKKINKEIKKELAEKYNLSPSQLKYVDVNAYRLLNEVSEKSGEEYILDILSRVDSKGKVLEGKEANPNYSISYDLTKKDEQSVNIFNFLDKMKSQNIAKNSEKLGLAIVRDDSQKLLNRGEEEPLTSHEEDKTIQDIRLNFIQDLVIETNYSEVEQDKCYTLTDEELKKFIGNDEIEEITYQPQEITL